MSQVFYKQTQDVDDNPRSQAVDENHPLPVRPILSDEDSALPVEVKTILPLEEYYAIGHEVVTVAATAVGLTASTYQNADRAFMTLETAQIRFRYDGAAAPTSTTGHILDVAVPLTVDGKDSIRNFAAIRTGGSSGSLTVTYERRR